MTVAYNIDCMEAMAKMKDKEFDLAIVDPPYGLNIAKRNGSIGQKKGQGKITKYISKDWDNAIPDKKYFTELFRVSKNQFVFGANYFTKYLPASSGWVVWDKRQPEGVSFAMAELCYSSFPGSVKMFACSRALIGNKVANNLRVAMSNAKIHPTQKPIALYRWLIDNYAKPGDKILDTHLGSGSSRIAAHQLGFDFTGYELDAEYFQAQEKRFKLVTSQMRIAI